MEILLFYFDSKTRWYTKTNAKQGINQTNWDVTIQCYLIKIVILIFFMSGHGICLTPH